MYGDSPVFELTKPKLIDLTDSNDALPMETTSQIWNDYEKQVTTRQVGAILSFTSDEDAEAEEEDSFVDKEYTRLADWKTIGIIRNLVKDVKASTNHDDETEDILFELVTEYRQRGVEKRKREKEALIKASKRIRFR